MARVVNFCDEEGRRGESEPSRTDVESSECLLDTIRYIKFEVLSQFLVYFNFVFPPKLFRKWWKGGSGTNSVFMELN